MKCINWEPFSGPPSSPYSGGGKPKGGTSFLHHRSPSLCLGRRFCPLCFATDVLDGDFGRTYSYIGPDVASFPGVDADIDLLDQPLTKEVQP